jgi:hypothetical protein
MFQRDYILRLIEDFARFMAAMSGLKREGKLDDAMTLIDEAYRDLFKVEARSIKSLKPDELIQFLQAEKGMNNEALKMIGELLYEEGMIYVDHGDPVSAVNVLQKSKVVIHYLMEHDHVYSFDRNEKLLHINKIIGVDD